MPINLKTPVVESREQRLGTITAWDGKASELAEQSGYAHGDCSRCGKKARKICEIQGPFTQGSVCSEMMVECQAGNVRGAVTIQHSPIGCGTGQVIYNSLFRNGLAARGLPVESLHLISTNLREKDMVYGGIEKLEASVREAKRRHNPKAIFIATSCATGIIGDDVDGAAANLEEELGIPVIPLHCEGFKSKHWSTGFDATQHGIVRQLVRKNPQKQEDLVNVINLWGSDVFTPMLKELDLRVNYVVDMATVEDLQQLSEAAATVSHCYTLATYMAQALEQEYGVPEIKAPQPYGSKGTDAWLRELARVTKREEKAEAYIAREHERIADKLAELRNKLKGVKGFIATGSAYAHAMIEVLRELGVEVESSLVFHHDPVYDSQDSRQDTLSHLVDNAGDVHLAVGNRQQYQFHALLQNVKPDFIIIRHNGLAPLASRLGIPSIPLGDEHHPLGYQGLLNLGESILDVLAQKKFHQDLAAHVRLPYSKWWLAQKDPYILSRKSAVDAETVDA